VISTLDFKRTTLSELPWHALPPAMTGAAARVRMGGGAARFLLALRPPLDASSPLLLPGDRHFRAAFRRDVGARAGDRSRGGQFRILLAISNRLGETTGCLRRVSSSARISPCRAGS
jgi:hypothetical protein